MRLVGIFLSACVILAAIKAAIVALFLLLLIALLWCACIHPREVAGCLVYCVFFGLLNASPSVSLALIGFAVLVSVIAKAP